MILQNYHIMYIKIYLPIENTLAVRLLEVFKHTESVLH